MKNIDVFSATNAGLSSVVGIFGGYFIQSKNINSIDRWLYFIFIFLVVLIFFYFLTNYMLSYFRSKMRRYFSRSYIEGDWLQVIDDKRLEELPPTKFTFLTVFYEDGEIRIRGASYDDNQGQQTTNFYSVASEYLERESTLKFVYKFTTDEENYKKTLFGETQLVFGKYNKSRILNKYKGVVHSNLRDDVRVIAVKIEKNDSFNFSNKISRQRVISTIKEAFLQ